MDKNKEDILNVINGLKNKYHTVSFLISAIRDQVDCSKKEIKEVLNKEVQAGRLIRKFEIVCPIHNHTLGFANFKNEIKEKYKCKECDLEIPISKLKVLKHYYFNEKEKYA